MNNPNVAIKFNGLGGPVYIMSDKIVGFRAHKDNTNMYPRTCVSISVGERMVDLTVKDTVENVRRRINDVCK